MKIELLKSKIHRAIITGSDIHYEGSITIDETLMKAVDLAEYEKVHILDVTNGARFITYVITGKKDTGEIILNGAAARLVHVGDLLIILSFCSLDKEEAKSFKPKIVHVDGNNHIVY